MQRQCNVSLDEKEPRQIRVGLVLIWIDQDHLAIGVRRQIELSETVPCVGQAEVGQGVLGVDRATSLATGTGALSRVSIGSKSTDAGSTTTRASIGIRPRSPSGT